MESDGAVFDIELQLDRAAFYHLLFRYCCQFFTRASHGKCSRTNKCNLKSEILKTNGRNRRWKTKRPSWAASFSTLNLNLRRCNVGTGTNRQISLCRLEWRSRWRWTIPNGAGINGAVEVPRFTLNDHRTHQLFFFFFFGAGVLNEHDVKEIPKISLVWPKQR